VEIYTDSRVCLINFEEGDTNPKEPDLARRALFLGYSYATSVLIKVTQFVQSTVHPRLKQLHEV
jgi:hypothetical protein